MGWTVHRFWEEELKDYKATAEKLAYAIRGKIERLTEASGFSY